MRISDGKVVVEKTGPATDLEDSPADVVNLGSDYNAAWGKFKPSSTWSGSNRSAFADAARTRIGLGSGQTQLSTSTARWRSTHP